jgi:hypothetical protein
MGELRPEEVAIRVGQAFEQARVSYLLGGSMACSVWGEPRSTLDLDFSADLRPEVIDPWIQALGADFEVDRGWVAEAVTKRSFFCFLFRPTYLKVDVYVRPHVGFARSERERAKAVQLAESGGASIRVASAEDTILSKLWWYRISDGASERQWRDVLGVLRTCGDGLERPYLRAWARELAVADLLDRALEEVGLGASSETELEP